MLTWHYDIDYVYDIAGNHDFKLDRTRHGEDMHLELFKDFSETVRPIDWVFLRCSNSLFVY